MKLVIELKPEDADGLGGKILAQMGMKRCTNRPARFGKVIVADEASEDDFTSHELLVRRFVEALCDFDITPRFVRPIVKDIGKALYASAEVSASADTVTMKVDDTTYVVRKVHVEGEGVPHTGGKEKWGAFRKGESASRADSVAWMPKGTTAKQAAKRLLGSAEEEVTVTAAVGMKLSPQRRSRINEALIKKGFGGQGRYRKVGSGVAEVLKVLSGFGIEQDEVISSFKLSGPSGSTNIELAWTNEEDSFSPWSIPNSMLRVQWHELENGQFEVLAYLS